MLPGVNLQGDNQMISFLLFEEASLQFDQYLLNA
jgi:hypothetical protein